MGQRSRPSWAAWSGSRREGNVYIADYGNHRVRKVDAAGTITTLAGIGAAGGTAGTAGPPPPPRLG